MMPGRSLLSALPSLGFDIKAGIEYCGNDEAFYSDLIRELHADVLPLRTRSLRDGDIQTRTAFAHMLKGTLRTLGANEVSKKAQALELALRNSEPGEELTQDLLQSLEKLDHSLGNLLRHG